MEKKRSTTKKWILVFLLVVFVGVILLLIYKRSIIGDLSQTKEIKIRVFFDITGYDHIDYTISDANKVQEICNTFSELKLKDYRSYCKPYGISYALTFMDSEGERIKGISVVTGGDCIDCGTKGLFEITNDINMQEYMESVVEELAPKVEIGFYYRTKAISKEDAKLLWNMIKNGNWEKELCQCTPDYRVLIDNIRIDYHSECGTFNWSGERPKHWTVDEETKRKIDEILEKIIFW